MATRISRANGTPTLTTKCTFSAWVKRSDSAINNSGRDGGIIETYTGANDYGWIRFDGSNQIQIYARNSSGNLIVCDTSAKFRDVSAWYHIVAVFDSTESTASNRVKLYVNGELQTFQGSPIYPNSSAEVWFNRASATFNIGNSEKYTSNFQFDGQYSHVHFIDGAVYQASTFGSTDATTGEWQINTSPTITEYGANGFFLFKDDASLNDDSGKGNNFTLNSGSVQKTEDNPSNNFATLNPLINPDVGNRSTYSNGNLKGNTTSAGHISGISTMAVNEGKFYCESKSGSSGSGHVFGVIQANKNIKGTDPQDFSGLYGVSADGTRYVAGTQTSSWGGSYTYNNIMGLALDMDASPPKLHIHYNGSYSNGSGAYNQTFDNSVPITLAADETYHFFFGDNTSSGTYDHQVNFGNGYFATTAISSEGTNASGHGKFEYDVPTGYTALCTKGLNE
tara:strand:+ start:431 stop:1783 length:1353 start_codon:yes stop_codon:yes gene_type:complete